MSEWCPGQCPHLASGTGPDLDQRQKDRWVPLLLQWPARPQQSHSVSLEHPNAYTCPTRLSIHTPAPPPRCSLPCRSLLRRHFTLGSLASCLQSSAAKTKVAVSTWGSTAHEQIRRLRNVDLLAITAQTAEPGFQSRVFLGQWKGPRVTE